MKDFIENIKGLLPLIAAIAALAGFYYSTQHRLDHLENEIINLKEQDKKLKKIINKRIQNEKTD